MADYRQALKYYPVGDPTGYLLRGDLQLTVKDRAAALADYRQALRLAQQQNDPSLTKWAQAKISSVSDDIAGKRKGFNPATLGVRKKTRRLEYVFIAIHPGNAIAKNPDIRKADEYVRQANTLYMAKGKNITVIKYLQEAATLYQKANKPTKVKLLESVIRELQKETSQP
jgi:tetratricopeptide (TPR) repeat protein